MRAKLLWATLYVSYCIQLCDTHLCRHADGIGRNDGWPQLHLFTGLLAPGNVECEWESGNRDAKCFVSWRFVIRRLLGIHAGVGVEKLIDVGNACWGRQKIFSMRSKRIHAILGQRRRR
jgi:hypothetical protein